MKKVTFLFKSGSQVQFMCESFEVSSNRMTGELMGYSAKGIKGTMPMYSRVEDIDCIYADDVQEDDKLVYPEGIED